MSSDNDWFSDTDAYDRIMGYEDHGLKHFCEDDIRSAAAVHAKAGEPCSEAMIQAAIRGLAEYQSADDDDD